MFGNIIRFAFFFEKSMSKTMFDTKVYCVIFIKKIDTYIYISTHTKPTPTESPRPGLS